MGSMMNRIHWEKRTPAPTPEGRSRQSAWYDHSWVDVPFSGVPDVTRMKSALIARKNVQSFGKFGGGSSISDVTLTAYDEETHTGVITVESLYHIGD